jgi:peptidyl-prolyl cis-trans isomerase SurA
MSSLRRLVALAGVLGAVALLPAVRAEIIEQILVKVNGEILTKTEFEARQVGVLRQRGEQLSDEALKKAIAEITPQLLVDTIDEMLLVQRGKDLGLKLSDEQFANIVDNIKKENKLESDEAFAAALKQENLTIADLRKTMERNMLVSRVQQTEVLSRISVAEAEAKSYYDQHASEFSTPAALTLREILVAVPTDGKTVNVGLDEEAKAKADAARARAAAGEAFEKLAGEVSDSPSKANGGLVGPVNEDELDATLRKIIDTMKVGAMSDVIRTQRGYLLLKLESKSEKVVLPFDQAREQIGDRVANSKSRGEMEKYLRKLRAEAIIDWKIPELKKIYEQKVAQTPSTPGTP